MKYKEKKRPLILGLTGSIAMGKSTIATLFAKKGIKIFESDKMIHHLYEEKAIQEKLQKNFPCAIQDTKVDRSKLSEHLIKFPKDLEKLERILHPPLAQEREKFLQKYIEEAFVIFDIPLLFEKNLMHLVDKILVVDAPKSVQRERALSRPEMNEEKFRLFLQKQIPNEKKCALADYVIDTHKSLFECEKEVNHLIQIMNYINREL